MFRKLNTSTEHDLESLMLLRGNSFQNVTFFSQESTKSYRRITFFFTKKSEICIFCAIQFDRDGLTS